MQRGAVSRREVLLLRSTEAKPLLPGLLKLSFNFFFFWCGSTRGLGKESATGLRRLDWIWHAESGLGDTRDLKTQLGVWLDRRSHSRISLSPV